MFEIDPAGGPPEIVGEEARRMLQEAMAQRSGCSRTVEGWNLTSHAAHLEDETNMAKLWNAWWEYAQRGTVFFGIPDGGAFVAAQKM